MRFKFRLPGQAGNQEATRDFTVNARWFFLLLLCWLTTIGYLRVPVLGYWEGIYGASRHMGGYSEIQFPIIFSKLRYYVVLWSMMNQVIVILVRLYLVSMSKRRTPEKYLGRKHTRLQITSTGILCSSLLDLFAHAMMCFRSKPTIRTPLPVATIGVRAHMRKHY